MKEIGIYSSLNSLLLFSSNQSGRRFGENILCKRKKKYFFLVIESCENRILCTGLFSSVFFQNHFAICQRIYKLYLVIFFLYYFMHCTYRKISSTWILLVCVKDWGSLTTEFYLNHNCTFERMK